jgi:MauM/NapG family ferredoxin protein
MSASRGPRARLAARRLVQALALSLFVLLLAGAPVGWADLAFRLDPLTVGLASLARGAWSAVLGGVAVLLLVTLLHGRLFCGWLCPLGALHDAIDSVSGTRPRAARARNLKLLLLLAAVGLLAGGLAFTWLLDPLTWSARLLEAVVPHPVEPVLAAILLALFVALALLLGRRGFCRVLCPLGALLGLVARVALLRRARDGERCSGCGRCQASCRMLAFAPGERFRHAECIHCYECETTCAAGAISVAPARHALAPVPLDRRATLFTLAGAAAVAASARLSPAAAARGARAPLRPPGSEPEDRFIALCIRCGACLRVCPSRTLVPARLEAGLAGLETPVLVPRRGGCRADCHACGQSCPTAAIRPLALEPKRTARIGRAVVERARCIVTARGRTCLSCFAACPFEAIEIRPSARRERWGDPVYAIVVDAKRCTGCGLCEASCPLVGEAAIRVQRQ